MSRDLARGIVVEAARLQKADEKQQLEVVTAELKLETSTEKCWNNGAIGGLDPDLHKGEVVYRLRKDLKGNTIIRFPSGFGSASGAYDIPYTPAVAEYVASN